MYAHTVNSNTVSDTNVNCVQWAVFFVSENTDTHYAVFESREQCKMGVAISQQC